MEYFQRINKLSKIYFDANFLLEMWTHHPMEENLTMKLTEGGGDKFIAFTIC